MSAANALVESGHTAEAVQISQLVTQGVRDGALFYNLGNAYYQQGDLGRAIVSYEQAAQLTPRDTDVRQNLAQARSQAKVAAPQPAGVLGSLAETSSHWLTVNELALLALGPGSCWASSFGLPALPARPRPAACVSGCDRLASC